MQQIIDINPVEPARLGIRAAAGTLLDIDFVFRDLVTGAPPAPGVLDISTAYPQLVLRPRNKAQAYGYDITVTDPVNGLGNVTIPGTIMNDDMIMEVYSRDSEGHPLRMLATGHISLTGGGYDIGGPLGPASYPTGPVGPAGPMGPMGVPGTPGAIWTTGIGAPGTDGSVTGDMYLDTATGNVWRWTGASWAIV